MTTTHPTMNTLSEREAFEAWAQKYPALEDDHGYVNLRYLGLHKQYVDFDVQRAWGSWQAALQWSAEASKQAEVQAAPPAPAARGQWLPIESAPKDGTDIIVMHVCIDTQIVHNAFWITLDDDDDEREVGWWSYEHSEVSRIKLEGWLAPTHWMPLPQPPKEQG